MNEKLFDALNGVRESGFIHLFDLAGVIGLMRCTDIEQANYIELNRDKYFSEIIPAFKTWLQSQNLDAFGCVIKPRKPSHAISDECPF
jgi:hypothetical protein